MANKAIDLRIPGTEETFPIKGKINISKNKLTIEVTEISDEDNVRIRKGKDFFIRGRKGEATLLTVDDIKDNIVTFTMRGEWEDNKNIQYIFL